MKKGLFGGALLLLGGAGFLATRRTAEMWIPPEGLLAMSDREYAVIYSIAKRLLPPRANFPSIDEVKVALNCDRILASVDPSARTELKQLLMLFENALAGFLFGRRTKPFTALEEDEQDAVLNEWATSMLTVRRTGYAALRSMVMAAYYGSNMTWKAAGYPGPPEGIYDPAAPVWKGGGTERPFSNGQFHEESEVKP